MRDMTIEQLEEAFSRQLDEASNSMRKSAFVADPQARFFGKATLLERRLVLAIMRHAWENRDIMIALVESDKPSRMLKSLRPSLFSKESLLAGAIGSRLEMVKSLCDIISGVLALKSVGTVMQRVDLLDRLITEFCDNIESELNAADAMIATSK